MDRIEAQQQSVDRTTREDVKRRGPAEVHRPWNYKSQSGLEQEITDLKQKRDETLNHLVQLEEENSKLKRQLKQLTESHERISREHLELYNKNQELISQTTELRDRVETAEHNELMLHRELKRGGKDRNLVLSESG